MLLVKSSNDRDHAAPIRASLAVFSPNAIRAARFGKALRTAVRLKIKHIPSLNAPFLPISSYPGPLFLPRRACGIPLAIAVRQKEEGRPGASDLAHVE